MKVGSKPYKVGAIRRVPKDRPMRKHEIGKMLKPLSSFCLSKGEKGDPQIQITQTWIDKNRYPFDYSKPIKLQEFPLRNKDINSEGTKKR